MSTATAEPCRLDFCVTDFPEYVLKPMAMAAIDLTKAILAQPGGRELLDAETAARKARMAKEERT